MYSLFSMIVIKLNFNKNSKKHRLWFIRASLTGKLNGKFFIIHGNYKELALH